MTWRHPFPKMTMWSPPPHAGGCAGLRRRIGASGWHGDDRRCHQSGGAGDRAVTCLLSNPRGLFEVIGFSRMAYVTDDVVLLGGSAVSEAWRGRGIYKTLVAARLRLARQAGAWDFGNDPNMPLSWKRQVGRLGHRVSLTRCFYNPSRPNSPGYPPEGSVFGPGNRPFLGCPLFASTGCGDVKRL